jgi:hypothetical protein
MKTQIKDMPKLESPFERQTFGNSYLVIPKIKAEFRWVITDKCLAVTKLDGTNVSVVVEDGKIIRILNRMNLIDIWKSGKWFFDGVRTAIDRDNFVLDLKADGQYFGELIGEHINGNPYKIQGNRWVPFDYLKERYYFKFWGDVIKECEGTEDQQVFNIIEDVFKKLWCIYKRQMGIKGEVDENTKFEGLAAEGIVFYNKETGEMCKLRRDMFPFFKGVRHVETDK